MSLPRNSRTRRFWKANSQSSELPNDWKMSTIICSALAGTISKLTCEKAFTRTWIAGFEKEKEKHLTKLVVAKHKFSWTTLLVICWKIL